MKMPTNSAHKFPSTSILHIFRLHESLYMKENNTKENTDWAEEKQTLKGDDIQQQFLLRIGNQESTPPCAFR